MVSIVDFIADIVGSRDIAQWYLDRRNPRVEPPPKSSRWSYNDDSYECWNRTYCSFPDKYDGHIELSLLIVTITKT